MSKFEKSLDRLLSVPSDFRWSELEVVLNGFGYKLKPNKKTGGSRRTFLNEQTGHVIKLHEPHPSNIVKQYALRQIISGLEDMGLIQ